MSQEFKIVLNVTESDFDQFIKEDQVLQVSKNGYSVTDGRQVYPQNSLTSSLLSSDSDPRMIWASNSDKLRADTSTTQTSQFFATKVRQRIIGRWKAIAPVFVGGYWNFTDKRPFTTAIPSGFCQIQCVLELPDGTQSLNFNSPNTSGTLINVTFNGATTTNLHSWKVTVGDLIFATDHGRQYWDFADTNLALPHQQPWLRTAFAKNSAADVLFMVPERTAAAPAHDATATASSFALLQGLITTAGIVSYGSSNRWGSGDTDGIPTCIGWVGIPVESDQQSVLFFGTSIAAGETERNRRPTAWPTPFGTGTDWSAITWDVMQPVGWPNWAMNDQERAFPGLNLAVGAGAMCGLYGSSEDSSLWATFTTNYQHDDIENARGVISELSRYFTICIANDVHNDNITVAEYQRVLRTWTQYMRRSNPKLKIYGARVPNGGVDINGSTVNYAAGLDDRWNEQIALVASGWWNGMLDLEIGSAREFPNTGVLLTTSVNGTGATTTSIPITTAGIPSNFYARSWARINGETRVISQNDGTTLTLATALSTAPGNGVTVEILGNTAGGTNGLDLVHMNAHGARTVANQFHTEIRRFHPTFRGWPKLR